MKKYSSLFLFVVLLNATSNAQPIDDFKHSATATGSLSRTAATALQSLGRAVTAIFYPVAEIASPMTLAPLPSAPAKFEAAQATQEVTNASASAFRPTLVSDARAPLPGRGIRNRVSQSLKGQSTGDSKIDGLIVSAASHHGLEPLLLYSVMSQESAFNDQAVSPKGARGLMQLMPATAARFGVTNILDPQQNIYAGARYLSLLLDMFDGDVSLALAGYNAGEGAVKKYGYNVPPYPETINYVRKIKRRYLTLSAIPE
ncbi:MAG TPA: lytic transglycosylase domain-containing protein [Blastocatellia bacterium]|nr:lytic transglycosylase domain-containing protein [Blastocatellia bacterium]